MHVGSTLAAVGTGGGADSPEARALAAALGARHTDPDRGWAASNCNDNAQNASCSHWSWRTLFDRARLAIPSGAIVAIAIESGCLLLTPNEKNHPVAHLTQ